MAFVFDATISGADSNSYVLVADADFYFDGTYNDVWSALVTSQKEELLAMATTRLESETYGGYQATTTQILQHPRDKLISRYAEDYKRDMGGYPSGVDQYYPVDEVPKEMQQATFELAMYFLNKANNNLGAVREIDLEQLESYQVGPLNTKIASGFMEEDLPSKVKRMLIACGPNTWEGGRPRTAIRG